MFEKEYINSGLEKTRDKQRPQNVSPKLLRVHLFAVQRDRVPGGSDRTAERLYVLPLGLLQVLHLRHQIDIKDLLQQPAQAGGQRGEPDRDERRLD